MNKLAKFTLFLGLSVLFASPAMSWDFLYVERTIESSIITEVTALDLSGQGYIQLEFDCDSCPKSLAYNRDTRLTTPFSANRDIYEITQWQGHRAMVRYSTTNPIALEIVVYSETELEEDF